MQESGGLPDHNCCLDMELPINWILWRIEYQLVKAEIKPTAKFESGVFDGSCIDEAKLGMHTNTW